MRLLHIHLRREALLLLGEARLLLEPLLRLAAERASAPKLLLLRIALLLRKPLLLLRISLLRISRLLLHKLRLLLGITLLRRREALLTKTHGRLLRRLGPIQGRRRRRGARIIIRNKFLQPLRVRLSFSTGRI